MKTANNIIIKQIVDVMREARNEGSNQDKEDGSENQDEDDDDKAESSENQEQEDADGSDEGSNEDA